MVAPANRGHNGPAECFYFVDREFSDLPNDLRDILENDLFHIG